MARPEGYRKAMRLMRLAERNRLPIVTLIDTSGAHAIAPAKSAMLSRPAWRTRLVANRNPGVISI